VRCISSRDSFVTLTLCAADVARLLPMRAAIDIMSDAFTAISLKRGTYPTRTHIRLAQGDALIMPGYDGGPAVGTKIVTVHRANAAAGKPGTRATYVLVSAVDGEPLMICDGTALTALRTGAASGLATRRLARADAQTVAIFGTGAQAMSQLEAMFAVRPVREVRVVGRDAGRAQAFVVAARAKFPAAHIECSDSVRALAGAALVVTATNATSPVFAGELVEPGTHINAIGAFRPGMVELDAAVLGRARIVVDERDAALTEAGDLLAAIAAGALTRAAIATELGELGEHERRDPAQVTVFKSVGHAALDLFTALELHRRAQAVA
jgi:alanine dehydrogenase